MKIDLSSEHDTFNDESVVRLVQLLLERAIESRASDIHLEQRVDSLRVRFRIDGGLIDQEQFSLQQSACIIARLKVLAHLSSAERRLPQDGKFQVDYKNNMVDIRVATFPALYGEKMVVRILDRLLQSISLDQLGFTSQMLDSFKQLMQRHNGFFLVTGPTGSGKTTTLYAALSFLNKPEKNIMTIEDPIEYSLDGITQAQIHPVAGFTFEKGMKSLVRQDPDIIMIGEIRDKTTARIAIEAALTGHMILTTLHTGSAPGAIMRLMDMGIEPFLINAALSGILAQRLVRKLCNDCKEPYEALPEEKYILDMFCIAPDSLYIGRGCDSCGGLGYKGRIGIFELLEVSPALRALIIENPEFDAISDQALADGMITLAQDGAKKVVQGLISLQELIRVIV